MKRIPQKKYRPPRPMDVKGGCSPQNETNVTNNDFDVEGFLQNLCDFIINFTVGISPYDKERAIKIGT
jgi:hypothetical protein